MARIDYELVKQFKTHVAAGDTRSCIGILEGPQAAYFWCTAASIKLDLLPLTVRAGLADLSTYLLRYYPYASDLILIRTAVEAGHLHMCEWFAEEFPEESVAHYNLLPIAKHFNILKWLYEHSYPECMNGTCPNMAHFAAQGDLDACMWIKDHFNVAIRDHNNATLHNALTNGHLHVAKWLVHTYNLTKKDVLVLNGLAVAIAYYKGYVDICDWMNVTFGIEKPTQDYPYPLTNMVIENRVFVDTPLIAF